MVKIAWKKHFERLVKPHQSAFCFYTLETNHNQGGLNQLKVYTDKRIKIKIVTRVFMDKVVEM